MGCEKAGIDACIAGVDGKIPALSDVLEHFSGWLNVREFVVVRFEDLVGKRGGGDDERQRESVTAILQHIDLDLDENRLRSIIEEVARRNTSTKRTGQIDSWRRELTGAQLALFSDGRLGELMKNYGYV
jgi:hypothetical protein